MISSYLKLINIFSINPYLGPLQVSLGKMIVDICQFLVLYVLVLFSFGCGLNQLLWYYADLERQKCYCLPDGLPDWDVSLKISDLKMEKKCNKSATKKAKINVFFLKFFFTP